MTTAAALDAFGPDARLRTTVETAGRLDALGRILGDVYLVGRGDPNLSGRFTRRPRRPRPSRSWRTRCAPPGVRRIEGRLVGHEGLFSGDRRGDDWAWDDLVWCYGAEVSALSFNDNVAVLTVAPGRARGRSRSLVERVPAQRATTASSPPRSRRPRGGAARPRRLQRDFGSNHVRLSGALPARRRARRTLTVALEDPARYAATVFAEVLAAKGIRGHGRRGHDLASRCPRACACWPRHESAPLAEILKVVNKASQNLHTEMLLRLLGAQREGRGHGRRPGTRRWRSSCAALGVDAGELGAAGRAPGSRAPTSSPPHGMVGLLAAMDRHPHAAAFRDSLPVAGVDGTLENRMERHARAQGRVLAKTGTIRHVNALGGLRRPARRASASPSAIVVNHHTGPSSDAVAAIDAIATLLAAQ